MAQSTNTILMVRPSSFEKNEQTAVNNYYQKDTNQSKEEILEKAQKEFDQLVAKLTEAGVTIITVQEDPNHKTPDAVFPNNWISFHKDATIGIYPMFAPNRRLERRQEVLQQVEEAGFMIENVLDYTTAEDEELFLEGTGSLVLDRVHQKAYCALSERANEGLVVEFCEDFEFTPVIFTAYQTVGNKRLPIYHTNVMMSVASSFAMICLDSIDNKKERKNVVKHLKQDGKEIIDLTEAQINQFAGNTLQVTNNIGEELLVMSQSAYHSLTKGQLAIISKHSKILYSDLTTIETLGGGSARCMMAEVFLPKKT
ncbi:arginine deiminase-related protein [Aquimarina sp. ERC-38]|uniref:citrulline utilization hydrolase CtlX n=1 Tax=Aquimarina sp. ERC-38 TaxID=2949996 RepID=UPI00224826E6|nr:arginine deiminase-related protein [Aquimarina sp. ERC-38]UZO79225.1 arginine deiminase-related protein [Aquimarina sp. ERC-38]